MAQPTSSQVHVDAPLTNISVAYIQQASNFIASQVFPIVNVQKQSDKYFVYTQADWFRDEAKLRAPAAKSAGSGYNIGTASYSCDVFAIHKLVADQTRANADSGLDLDRDATQFVTQRLLVRMEKQFVTDIFKTGVWGTSATPTYTWDDYSASDPINDIETAKTTILTATGFLPNTMVCGYPTWVKLKHHPDIIARISGGASSANPAMVTKQTVAGILEIERILVAHAVNDTAVEGETAVSALIEGKHALVCYVNPTPGLLQPSAGYTFQWQGVSEGLGENVGIKRIRCEEEAADKIEGQIAFDYKVVATNLGYWFEGAVA